MATIGELLNILEKQAHELHRTEQDTVASHEAGWMPLSRMTGRAVALLPLGGHSDHVKAGVQNVLAPLAHGSRHTGTPPDPAPQLADLALTMGAISDSLAGVLRWGPRPEQVGLPALGLEASLLSAVHVSARWSLSTMADERLSVARPSIIAFLGDLVVVTEPYALIPPDSRASVFEDQGFSAPTSPGIEGVMAGWAEVASATLSDRYCISGWAMQTIAADLALICDAARRVFLAAGIDGQRAAARTFIAATLEQATLAWRTAAAWPPHVRLGGQSPELRPASRNLREYLSSNPMQSVTQAQRALAIALPVGVAQTQVMSMLVRKHELWISTPFLVPKVDYARGWTREPRWSAEGRPLLVASLAGQAALDRTLVAIGTTQRPGRPRTERNRWGPDRTIGLSAVASPIPQEGTIRRIGESPSP